MELPHRPPLAGAHAKEWVPADLEILHWVRAPLGTAWYSADPGKHAEIIGRVSYARTRDSLAEAVRRGIPVRAAIVEITEDQGIEQAAAELRSLGVTDICIRPSHGVGRAAHDGVELLVSELITNAVAAQSGPAAGVQIGVAVDHQQAQPAQTVQDRAQRREFTQVELARPVGRHPGYHRNAFGQDL